MIVDANALIALLDDQDSHHARAVDLIADPPRDLLVHHVTLAEALVYPATLGKLTTAAAALTELGIVVVDVGHGFAELLATVRATTHLTMPDAIVLATAEHLSQAIGTFDERLRRAAIERHITALHSERG